MQPNLCLKSLIIEGFYAILCMLNIPITKDIGRHYFYILERGVDNLKAFGIMIAFVFLLVGCNDTKTVDNKGLITEEEALRIVKTLLKDREGKYSASYKEDEEIEINNVKDKRKIWKVKVIFNEGGKETYIIDAQDGKILSMGEGGP
jgi:hypothetical protein